MKRFILSVLIIFPAVAFPSPDEFNKLFIRASGIVKPSVVNVVAYRRTVKNGNSKLIKSAYGTGTIISGNGFIVTNLHVVNKGDFFQAIDSNGFTHEMQKFENGSYYISDLKTDIAVLKIDSTEERPFYPVKIADSNTLTEGEWVIAVGNPYGLKQSITAGIVSSTGRDNIGFTDIEDFIQTDVSINPGNSGGPLVNLHGEMVGINTAIRSVSGGFQGISFAIPSNIVKQVCYDLLKYGRVRRGWLGFIAREKNFRERSSVEIISVIRNSPADSAGIRQGDIIREIDGRKIDSIGSLVKIVGNKPVGSKIRISVSRNGKIHDINLMLREKEEYVRIQKELSLLFQNYGIELDEDTEYGKLVVSYISPGSPYKEIEHGDTIISINGKKVDSMEDFIDKFSNSGRRMNVIEILRDSVVYEIRLAE